MKRNFFVLFCLIIHSFINPIIAQCPAGDLSLMSQAEVDAFQTDYPNCKILNSQLWISGTSVTNLNALSGLEEINEVLYISSTSLKDLSGMDNLTKIETFFLFSNDSLNTLAGLEQLDWSKQIWLSGHPKLSSLSVLSNLTTITRKLTISGNASLNDLSGLEGLIIGDDISISGNDNLTSLQGLHNISKLTGNLSISNNAMLTDLNGLSALKRIEGTFRIYNNPMLINPQGLNLLNFCEKLVIEENPVLLNLQGLSALNTVNEMELRENANMSNLLGLANIAINRLTIENTALVNLIGLEGLTDLDYFWINDNPDLIDFTGLTNLVNVAFFYVDNNDAMTSMAGLTSLTKVEEEFEIVNNDTLLSLAGLDNLFEVGNGIIGILPYFYIQNNKLLQNLTGLGTLSAVDGSFLIGGNLALEDLTGLEMLQFARELSISSNPELLSLQGLSSFGVVEDYLSIYNNPKLSSLAEMSVFDHVPTGMVSINNNPLLAFCAIDGICNLVENHPDKITVANNAIGCNEELEIENACSALLPIELNYFTASLNDQDIVALNWETLAERNNSHFTILHSVNGQDWNAIESLAAAGTTNVPIQYHTLDRNPKLGFNYYQLQQTDFDGKVSLANIVLIDLKIARAAVLVAPNPVTDKLHLQTTQNNLKSIRLINAFGKTIYQEAWNAANQFSSKTIELNHLPRGIYFLEINQDFNSIQKIILQ